MTHLFDVTLPLRIVTMVGCLFGASCLAGAEQPERTSESPNGQTIEILVPMDDGLVSDQIIMVRQRPEGVKEQEFKGRVAKIWSESQVLDPKRNSRMTVVAFRLDTQADISFQSVISNGIKWRLLNVTGKPESSTVLQRVNYQINDKFINTEVQVHCWKLRDDRYLVHSLKATTPPTARGPADTTKKGQ
jgi:hypothetical protein